MAVFETTITGPATTADIQIDYTHRNSRLSRVVVEYVSGSLATFAIDLSTDPTFAMQTKRVMSATGGTTTKPIDFDNSGVGYVWQAVDNSSKISVKVTPSAGTDNVFRIRLYFDNSVR